MSSQRTRLPIHHVTFESLYLRPSPALLAEAQVHLSAIMHEQSESLLHDALRRSDAPLATATALFREWAANDATTTWWVKDRPVSRLNPTLRLATCERVLLIRPGTLEIDLTRRHEQRWRCIDLAPPAPPAIVYRASFGFHNDKNRADYTITLSVPVWPAEQPWFAINMRGDYLGPKTTRDASAEELWAAFQELPPPRDSAPDEPADFRHPPGWKHARTDW